ncbi:MAG: flotillin family protein [Planctomycetota bacterium]
MDTAQLIGISVGLGSLAFLLLIIFVKSNMVICQPNEVVILSGRKFRQSDGSYRGYRVIHGGRGFKWPFVESVARISLNNVPVEIRLTKALTDGAIPITVEGRANVKVAGTAAQGLDAAIERFLGRPSEAVSRAAQQTLEGCLRGAISVLSPEAVNAQRIELARDVSLQAEERLRKLGIVLDFFLVQSISDEQGYLDAIARRKNAMVQRDARIAEAKAEAESRQVAAEQRRLGRLAEVEAEREIVRVENELAVHKAELETESNRAQRRSEVAGEIAKVESLSELETKRIDLSQRKQEADTLVPARAEAQAMELRARGEAARILEDGKATAEAVSLMRAQWEEGKSRDLFLIQMYPELVEKVTQVVAKNLHIDRLTVLDSGGGDGLGAHVRGVTTAAVTLLEQVKNATGMDLADLISQSGKKAGAAGSLPKELPG